MAMTACHFKFNACTANSTFYKFNEPTNSITIPRPKVLPNQNWYTLTLKHELLTFGHDSLPFQIQCLYCKFNIHTRNLMNQQIQLSYPSLSTKNQKTHNLTWFTNLFLDVVITGERLFNCCRLNC